MMDVANVVGVKSVEIKSIDNDVNIDNDVKNVKGVSVEENLCGQIAVGKIDFAKMKQYRQLVAEIAELEEEREALSRGHLPSSWGIGERVTNGKVTDSTAETVDKMWHLAELLAEKLNKLIALRTEIEGWLDSFEPDDRRMLRLYYVDGLTWEEVAERVGYSSRHLSRKIKRLQTAAE